MPDILSRKDLYRNFALEISSVVIVSYLIYEITDGRQGVVVGLFLLSFYLFRFTQKLKRMKTQEEDRLEVLQGRARDLLIEMEHLDSLKSPHFRTALCDMIKEIPESFPSHAREICESYVTPPIEPIVAALRSDVEKMQQGSLEKDVFQLLLEAAEQIDLKEVVLDTEPSELNS
jgi:hypothetical protein